MIANILGKAAYVALALSHDQKMGDDSAMECVIKDGKVNAFTSVTRAIPQNYGARRIEAVSDI